MDDQERARWVKLVADFESSDLTQHKFATERGVSFSNLRNWIYRLRKESRRLVADETEAWSSS
jgi:transposase